MDVKSYPRFVVTVLRDQAPILVLELQQDGTHSQGIDVFYQEVTALEEALQVLHDAADGLGFTIWKETGRLPQPRDVRTVDADAEPPF